MKLAAYSPTASWLAGAFAILPPLAILALLGLYSLYILYKGVPVVTRVPEDRALVFTLALIAVRYRRVPGHRLACLAVPCGGLSWPRGTAGPVLPHAHGAVQKSALVALIYRSQMFRCHTIVATKHRAGGEVA